MSKSEQREVKILEANNEVLSLPVREIEILRTDYDYNIPEISFHVQSNHQGHLGVNCSNEHQINSVDDNSDNSYNSETEKRIRLQRIEDYKVFVDSGEPIQYGSQNPNFTTVKFGRAMTQSYRSLPQ